MSTEKIVQIYFVVKISTKDGSARFAAKRKARSNRYGPKKGGWEVSAYAEQADHFEKEEDAKKAARAFLKSVYASRRSWKHAQVIEVRTIERRSIVCDVFTKDASIVDLVAGVADVTPDVSKAV